MRVIEVFADVSCPFSHVGLRRIVEERSRLGRHDVVIRARAWPLELLNGQPLAAEDVAEEVEALRRTVAPHLFEAFDPTGFPATSLPALALASSAYATGDEVGERVSLDLRTALFEQGQDIADPAVLTAVAEAAGMATPYHCDEQAPYDEWEEGKRRGVVGSPHFFVGDKNFFCPSVSIERVDGHLDVSPKTEDLDAFLTEAFDRASSRP